MKRRRIVRFQLLLLILVAALLFWQSRRGGLSTGSVASITRIDAGDLKEEAFEVAGPTMLYLSVTGSLQENGEPGSYGWVVSESGDVVWFPEERLAEADQRLWSVSDSIAVGAGRYRAYFTAKGTSPSERRGGSVLGLKPHWTNDARHWLLSVDGRPYDGPVDYAPTADASDVLWEAPFVSDYSYRTELIRVSEPSLLRVRAVAETCDSGCDQVWMVDAVNGAELWRLTAENSVSAGGYERNRGFDDTLAVPVGIYRVAVDTDGSHAAGSFDANPPLNPAFYGVSLAVRSGAAAVFDPWDGEAVAGFDSVRNDQLCLATLDVTAPSRAVVIATGEITNGGTRYDYGWLERGEDRQPFWEMDPDRTRDAGGDDSNQREIAFLELEPGRYTLGYKTDGSHAFGDWRRTAPPEPERWGAFLFPIQDDGSIQVIDSQCSGVGDAAPAPEVIEMVPMAPPTGELLFEAVSLGDDTEREGVIELDRAQNIRVIAIGEISQAGRYDYGWIETDRGENVWEMTMGNTESAGGSASNRRFDGIVRLEAGRYRVFFKTDFSHSYGDFSGGAPASPEDWGIQVYRAEADG